MRVPSHFGNIAPSSPFHIAIIILYNIISHHIICFMIVSCLASALISACTCPSANTALAPPPLHFRVNAPESAYHLESVSCGRNGCAERERRILGMGLIVKILHCDCHLEDPLRDIPYSLPMRIVVPLSKHIGSCRPLARPTPGVVWRAVAGANTRAGRHECARLCEPAAQARVRRRAQAACPRGGGRLVSARAE